MTQEFGWAVGGLLEHAAAMNAFLGPTVNCAKRYRKNTYAPASVTWGFENRSVAIRVKAGRGDATHIEDRLGSRRLESVPRPRRACSSRCSTASRGASSRRRRCRTTPTGSTSLVLLPRTLEDSLAAFEADDALRSAFHPEFVKAFLALKRHEIEKARAANPGYGGDDWHDQVTDWERDQFLFAGVRPSRARRTS